MTDSEHWDAVYGAKTPDAVSWYTPRLAMSLELIDRLHLPPTARILDVGGGASTLPRDLLDRGFERPTVLDISATALDAARRSLGQDADRVDWIVGDVTRADLPEATYDLWHDRAVFHFLTERADRQRYVDQVRRAVKPGGYVLVATFGPDGPEKCSGLPVVRYDAEGLHGAFGAPFERIDSATETHRTPWGAEQAFLYCLCRRVG